MIIYIYIYIYITLIYIYIYIYIRVICISKKIKLATVVKGDQKAPFSIATTRGVGGAATPFPWIDPLYP